MFTLKRLTLVGGMAVILFSFQSVFAMDSASQIKAKAQDEINHYYQEQIHVSVEAPGIVTLKGRVNSYWDKLNVFAIVSKIDGVREISNEIDVDTEMVPDKVITEEVRRDLDLNKALEDPAMIEVSTNHGLVFLRGTVTSSREANIAEDIASWHNGVLSVANELRVLPPKVAMSDAELNKILNDMIARDFSLEKNTVHATVVDGKATLTGTTRSLWALHQLTKETKRILGITSVDNQLKVGKVS
jgi:osmotically-inducible protein OsmY